MWAEENALLSSFVHSSRLPTARGFSPECGCRWGQQQGGNWGRVIKLNKDPEMFQLRVCILAFFCLHECIGPKCHFGSIAETTRRTIGSIKSTKVRKMRWETRENEEAKRVAESSRNKCNLIRMCLLHNRSDSERIVIPVVNRNRFINDPIRCLHTIECFCSFIVIKVCELVKLHKTISWSWSW